MSDAPVLDERAHRAVVDALLEAVLGADTVFDYGTVPGADNNGGTMPRVFVLVTIERRYADPRHAGRASRSGWRITTRYVGTKVGEARWAAFVIAEAFDGVRLTVDGKKSTPVAHEGGAPIEKDADGRFSGVSSFTYAL